MVQRFSTPPSHGGNTGSNPVSATKIKALRWPTMFLDGRLPTLKSCGWRWY